ncbi:NADH-quinone oxidoreductase subunit D [Thermotomaculum hydrothermale]|uniref:NADH-quinone oxidoreductase subunit D n=1 Tax=Thermotomaculum hydrothermale TaxID=981385 RepID=A0A7R6PXW2_9BACT|nr:NADH dehydrogenase (quinone) subunit D [Thermotomaculum hydrothermale]BBB32780.1 NADH-quinone oxidoreductase subunit D [Thermotomaculum hydrothermale]
MTNIKKELDIKTDRMIVNMGPSHPITHGTLHIILELEGETIVGSETRIGYLHRGVEKLGENRTYQKFIPFTDRMNYTSSINNNVGYTLAVEKLLGIQSPPRAQVIEVIACELGRIADHIVCVGINAVDIGAFSAFLYLFKYREFIYDIFERMTGGRLTTSYTRIGGVKRDLDDVTIDKIRQFIKEFPKAVDELEALLTKNRIWYDRTRGIGEFSAEDAISYGYTGPCLRACGVEWDLRKVQPYLGYENYEFEVPVGTRGDVYDRYLVRVEEMRQSVKILEQAIENLPEGPIIVDDPRIVLPPKEEVYNTIEGLICHMKLIMEGVKPPAGEIYSATEAANGELGFYIVSDGEARPYRIRVRPPCFPIFSSFDEQVKGHMIADAVAILGSLNIIAGELDR